MLTYIFSLDSISCHDYEDDFLNENKRKTISMVNVQEKKKKKIIGLFYSYLKKIFFRRHDKNERRKSFLFLFSTLLNE